MMITFRRVTPADRPDLLSLYALAERANEGGYSPAVEISGPDPVENSWMVEAEPGLAVGYSLVEMVAEAARVNFWLHGTVHPDWRQRGLGRELMRRSWIDMRDLHQEYRDRPAFVNTWAYQRDEACRRLFARFGLQPYHIYHELVIPAAQVGPVPPLPAGVIIRPWQDHHCELAVSLRNRAFAGSWGYQPTTVRALRRCFNTGRYEPDYSFTAWQGVSLSEQRMVGLIHCCLEWTRKLRRANEAEIVWLAVAPEARGRGVAQALLLTAVNRLREAGVELISVGADNPAGSPAPGVYTRLGFKVRKAIVDYQGELQYGFAEKS